MPKKMILVVVADGGVARFFTWPKAGERLAEHDDLRMEAPEAEKEQGPAPRMQDSVGHQRHKFERHLTAHQANEEKFLVDVAHKITELMARFTANRLILCAAPRALGSLRTALEKSRHDVQHQYEIATLDKDVVKESPAQIDQRVSDLRSST